MSTKENTLRELGGTLNFQVCTLLLRGPPRDYKCMKCMSTHFFSSCTAMCDPGYQFPNGLNYDKRECDQMYGEWFDPPGKNIPDCVRKLLFILFYLFFFSILFIYLFIIFLFFLFYFILFIYLYIYIF